ncbi:MAG: helix-turn-helix domain-containing protein [Patescibacteria group bacterium]
MEKRFFTIKEAAKFLGVSTLTLRNWDKAGKLPASRHPINNYRIYTITDLEKFLTQFKQKTRRKIPVILIKD